MNPMAVGQKLADCGNLVKESNVRVPYTPCTFPHKMAYNVIMCELRGIYINLSNEIRF